MPMFAIVDIIAQFSALAFSYYDTKGCDIGFSSECNKPKVNEDDLIFTVAINHCF